MLRDSLEIEWTAIKANLMSAMPQHGLIRILLIDGHDLRRDTRERLLRNAGYEVVTAARKRSHPKSQET